MNFHWTKPARFLGAAALTIFLTGNLLSGAVAAEKPAVEKPAADKPSGDKSGDGDAVADEVKKRAESNQERINSSQQRLKRTMARFGVEDDEAQDLIIAHVKEEIWAQAKIHEKASRLSRALRDKSISDKTLKGLTDELQVAIAADRKRRDEADKRLDRKIKYSENPRMEAMLLMFGIIGDGPMMTDMNPSRRSDRREKKD